MFYKVLHPPFLLQYKGVAAEVADKLRLLWGKLKNVLMKQFKGIIKNFRCVL